MNLAILHYHLGRGGVTRVIANHLLSLDATTSSGKRLQVRLFCDGQTDGWPDDLAEQLPSCDIKQCTVPSLGYWTEATTADLDGVYHDLNRELSATGFDPTNTVLHAHNHSLGKNAAFPAALRRLAGDGYAMLLQPHDFAEDFRPAQYRVLRSAFDANELSRQIYFHGPRVHYATLNRRDYEVLNQGGISSQRLHFLPNPVPDVETLPPRNEARAALNDKLGVEPSAEYVLYPVRGIRRKNLGEFVLLSLLRNAQRKQAGMQGRSVFGITLDPANPAAIPYYERWRAIAEKHSLPCLFGVGGEEALSFGENLAAADRILTTSVAEGFGMVFLESWLAGRPLVGRDLPEITSDFVESGLQLDALFPRLDVPLEWVGREAVIDAIHAACRQVYDDYGLTIPNRADVAAALERSTMQGMIDFGSLDEPLQEKVIQQIIDDEASSIMLLDANPALTRWDAIDGSTVAENQSVIREEYSLQASGRRLREIYDRLLQESGSSSPGVAEAEALLAAFLDLDRFRLIRT